MDFRGWDERPLPLPVLVGPFVLDGPPRLTHTIGTKMLVGFCKIVDGAIQEISVTIERYDIPDPLLCKTGSMQTWAKCNLKEGWLIDYAAGHPFEQLQIYAKLADTGTIERLLAILSSHIA
jgi:hypothetical protein